MADRLCGWDGGVIPPHVDAAMRAVPREAFLPGTPLTDAYGGGPVVTHRDATGVATSSASAPGIVAAMLAQLDVHPGHRILEIGAGTGYNAALLAHLAGPAGQVTTVELDPAIAAEAGKALTEAGYEHIDEGQPADAAALQNALSSGPTQIWTGIEVTVTGELDFWLAGLDGFFRLLAGNDAVMRSDLVPPAFNWGAMGLLTRDSFAYLTRRPTRPGHSELGACGYGPQREQLTSTYANRIRAFGHDRAKADSLRLEVHPATHAQVPDTLMQSTSAAPASSSERKPNSPMIPGGEQAWAGHRGANYDSWQETIYLLRSPANARRLFEAIARDKKCRPAITKTMEELEAMTGEV